MTMDERGKRGAMACVPMDEDVARYEQRAPPTIHHSGAERGTCWLNVDDESLNEVFAVCSDVKYGETSSRAIYIGVARLWVRSGVAAHQQPPPDKRRKSTATEGRELPLSLHNNKNTKALANWPFLGGSFGVGLSKMVWMGKRTNDSAATLS